LRENKLDGLSRRLASVHIATTGTASVVNLRDGSVTGTIRYSFNGAINSDKTVAFTPPSAPLFPVGCYVELNAGTVSAITLDLY